MPRTDTCDSVSLLVQVSKAEFAAGYQTSLQPLLAPSGNPQISCKMTAVSPTAALTSCCAHTVRPHPSLYSCAHTMLLSHRRFPLPLSYCCFYTAAAINIALTLLLSHHRTNTAALTSRLSHQCAHTVAFHRHPSTSGFTLLPSHCCSQYPFHTVSTLLLSLHSSLLLLYCSTHTFSNPAALTLLCSLSCSRTMQFSHCAHHTVVSCCCCCSHCGFALLLLRIAARGCLAVTQALPLSH